MPAFSFEALDAQGQTRKGLLEADTAKSARSMLRAQALVPLTVELVQTGQTARFPICTFPPVKTITAMCWLPSSTSAIIPLCLLKFTGMA